MKTGRWISGVLFSLLAVAACGDGTGPGSGGMSARIDGANWSAVDAGALQQQGAISLAGSNATGTTIAFAWMDEGTGTYTIGTSVGTNASFTIPGQGIWSASVAQGSGTITVTNRTDDRVAGTFSFVMEPAGGGATGTVTITEGSFDVEF